MRLWDPFKGQQLLQLTTGPFGMRTLGFSDDGRRLNCLKHGIGDVARSRMRIRVFAWRRPGFLLPPFR